jgi:hypothetical protein
MPDDTFLMTDDAARHCDEDFLISDEEGPHPDEDHPHRA